MFHRRIINGDEVVFESSDWHTYKIIFGEFQPSEICSDGRIYLAPTGRKIGYTKSYDAGGAEVVTLTAVDAE